MPLLTIESRRRELDAFFGRVGETLISDETRSDLARYGIVLVCGFVERSVEAIIMDRIAQRAHPRVQRFVKVHFERGTNYHCEAIEQLLERFDLGWVLQFRTSLAARDDLRQALRSAYSLRNAIAHGGSANPGPHRVRELYESAKEMIGALERSTT